MDTGINDDYIKRVFSRIIENDPVYGLFENNQLMGIAGWTIFEDKYAVLGRLRTDRRHQGKGIATKLLKHLLHLLNEQDEIIWRGLATQQNNTPAKKLAEKLGMISMATFHSLKERSSSSTFFEKIYYEKECITSPLDIKHFIMKEDKKTLNMFPYECYYPLPFDPTNLSLAYLSEHRLYEWKDRYILVKEDEKGEKYLHIKYFWDDFFEQAELLNFVLSLARNEKRKLWLDLSEKNISNMSPQEIKLFDIESPWIMYGFK